MVPTETTALRAGGFFAAIWSPLKPPHEMPIIPTLPLHQGCFAIHAMTRVPSLISVSEYSSVMWPSLSPVPVMSVRMTAYPALANLGRLWSSRAAAVASRLRYGRYSRIAGTGCVSALLGIQMRAARARPSLSGMKRFSMTEKVSCMVLLCIAYSYPRRKYRTDEEPPLALMGD